jgi:hypothetical protein
MLKKAKGKDNLTVYVVVEKIGDAVKTEENAAWEGKEFPLPEMLEKLSDDK